MNSHNGRIKLSSSARRKATQGPALADELGCQRPTYLDWYQPEHRIRKAFQNFFLDLHAQAARNSAGGACAQPRPFAIAITSVTKAIRVRSRSLAARFSFVLGSSPRLRASAVRFGSRPGLSNLRSSAQICGNSLCFFVSFVVKAVLCVPLCPLW